MNEQYSSIFNTIDFEKIIDHPNILIAAAFWDDKRYKAARICYKYMPAIDDLSIVTNRPIKPLQKVRKMNS